MPWPRRALTLAPLLVLVVAAVASELGGVKAAVGALGGVACVCVTAVFLTWREPANTVLSLAAGFLVAALTAGALLAWPLWSPQPGHAQPPVPVSSSATTSGSVAVLRGADLHGAHLAGAILVKADLSGANLRGADLRGADLTQACLRGADLAGATWDGARLDGADLTGAIAPPKQQSGAAPTGCRGR